MATVCQSKGCLVFCWFPQVIFCLLAQAMTALTCGWHLSFATEPVLASPSTSAQPHLMPSWCSAVLREAPGYKRHFRLGFSVMQQRAEQELYRPAAYDSLGDEGWDDFMAYYSGTSSKGWSSDKWPYPVWLFKTLEVAFNYNNSNSNPVPAHGASSANTFYRPQGHSQAGCCIAVPTAWIKAPFQTIILWFYCTKPDH